MTLYTLALIMCIPGTEECRAMYFPPARQDQCHAMLRLVAAEAKEEGFRAMGVCFVDATTQEASNGH